jgi:hypothetical protein
MARRSWRLQWLICFAASTLVVLLGVDFGRYYVAPGPWFKAPEPLIGLMANWDGGFFVGIVQTGYSYTPGKASLIHFFHHVGVELDVALGPRPGKTHLHASLP